MQSHSAKFKSDSVLTEWKNLGGFGPIRKVRFGTGKLSLTRISNGVKWISKLSIAQRWNKAEILRE